jgi:uncharacterized membrane protein
VRTERLETFSDGVFAIAITLLILDVRVPEPDGRLGQALAHQWPSYAAYVVSFLTIGVIWVNHHYRFSQIAHANRQLMFLNLFLLLVVAAIPFPTALMARYLREGSGQHLAAAVYAATYLAMGLAFGAMWRYASRRRELLADHLSDEHVEAIARRNLFGPVAYALAVAAAPLSPYVTFAICAAVAIYYVFPGRQTAEDAIPGESGPS